jgi:thiol:disulfide interchange protein
MNKNTGTVKALVASALLLGGLVAGPLISRAVDAAGSKGPATKGGIQWSTTVDAARAEAKKSGRPILVEFYADWCGPCKEMARTTLKAPAVVNMTRSFVPVRVNVDQNPAFAAKYGVGPIPSNFVIKPSGEVILYAPR